ncbi:substrate-binding domain-containing protein [Thiohalomonas denitrificans]|uniref:Phosphonate transport system substrate-binding protein n=1 Tax=Thiohalomonas denitrificans TaxID=415747 RepID=A0A1G5PZN4_9GAMM|nr:PhnD/SsuA/transferrin family substrate-binding protein [Thiohalomonas denitrificans]SCZ54529.1 phosphonate transport system substrate-binding protein [Thiohalomonas denitrificans]
MYRLNRRQFLGLCSAGGLLATRLVGATEDPIRIGITPVFLTEQTSLLREWRDYLHERLGRPVLFVQRDTYREIVGNLLSRQLDFAWICGYPYVQHRNELALTATPLYEDEPLYRAFFIVPARDLHTRSIVDLKGGVFAYADPDSNSGFLVPRFTVKEHGADPNHFFRKTFFTAGHRNAIEAVSTGLADGAYVDGYVWNTLAKINSDITGRTRIVARSRAFAFPPIVGGPAISKALNERMQRVLVGMSQDQNASPLLQRLNLDGFAVPEAGAYDAIAVMARKVGEVPRVP